VKKRLPGNRSASEKSAWSYPTRIELDQVNDEILTGHLRQAWNLITKKKKS